jgi:hypothetical protein
MRKFDVRRGIAVLLALLMPLMTSTARAEGTFIPASKRTDIAYDDARGLLYISNGPQVLRYQLSTKKFLKAVTLAGTYLIGLDISPDGTTLAVTDGNFDFRNNLNRVHLIDLDSLKAQTVNFPQSFDEAGTFAVAYGNDGRLLISSAFDGSGGQVPLRLYTPSTGQTEIVANIDSRSMLSPNAGRTIIALAEADNDFGPFGDYVVSTGALNVVGANDFNGTGAFNYEIAVNRGATLYAIPTAFGTYIANKDLKLTAVVTGTGDQTPVTAIFHPSKDLVYFPFAYTTQVRVYNPVTWRQVDAFDFEDTFMPTGGFAYGRGREKLSKKGSILFVCVTGGVRYVKTKSHHH